MAKITIEGLKFNYGRSKILDGLSVAVGDSEVLSLVGPNGCGKTTLIKCICGILRPEGTILLGEDDVSSMSRREVARYIGYVPQSTTSVLSTTVFDTILMGRKPHMGWRVADDDIDTAVEYITPLDITNIIKWCRQEGPVGVSGQLVPLALFLTIRQNPDTRALFPHQVAGINVSPDFILMTPYLVVIVALLLFARSTSLPSSLCIPYKREGN